MNKTEMIEELAVRTSLTQSKSGEVVNVMLDILTEQFEKHENVHLLYCYVHKAGAASKT